MKRKILIVDDDRNLLSSFRRQLASHFDVAVAEGGEEALRIFSDEGPFAIVISDYRMPGMDGVEFLAKCKDISQDSVRLLLTGFADVDTAIRAVNEGGIFRLLTKPCTGPVLARALMDAVRYHELMISERELLERTLRECVRLSGETLSLVRPDLYGRISRMLPVVRSLCSRLAPGRIWEAETAARLSMIGYVTLPDGLAEKIQAGRQLTASESEVFSRHPAFAARLIGAVPRMEGVAAAVAYQEKHFDGGGTPVDNARGEAIPLIARMLKVAADFDAALAAGASKTEALELMRKRQGRYDPAVLDALAGHSGDDARFRLRRVHLLGLEPGMIVARDIEAEKKGQTHKIIARGHELTEMSIEYLLRYAKTHNLVEPIEIVEQLDATGD